MKTMSSLNKIIFSSLLASFGFPSLVYATTYKKINFENNSNVEFFIRESHERRMCGRPAIAGEGIQLSPGEKVSMDYKTCDGGSISLVQFQISEIGGAEGDKGFPSIYPAFEIGAQTAWLIQPDKANAIGLLPNRVDSAYGYYGPQNVSPYQYYYDEFFKTIYAEDTERGDLSVRLGNKLSTDPQ